MPRALPHLAWRPRFWTCSAIAIPRLTISTQGTEFNTAGFRFNAPNPLTENTYVARIDFNLSSKHKLVYAL